MTLGSWLFNLPPWGRKLYDNSYSRVMFWTFGVIALIITINRPIWTHFIFRLVQMSVAATSILIDSYHHSIFCNYSMFYFWHLIEYVFIVSLLSLQNVCDYDSLFSLSFFSNINLDHVKIQNSETIESYFKGGSNQRTTWSSWRECRRRRNCDDYLEWSP